LFDNVVIF